MNKVVKFNQYKIVDELGAENDNVVDVFDTRREARKAFQELGGAAERYALKQVSIIQMEQKIR